MSQFQTPWLELGAVSITPGNPPTINWALGCFPKAAASYSRNGAGDYSITLPNEYAVDSTEFDWKAQQQEAAAASGLTSFGLAHTSDVVKRVTMLREAALGATSALTDIGTTVIRFFKRVVRT